LHINIYIRSYLFKGMKTQINITVETSILEDFNKLGLNRSQICEDALRKEVLNHLGIEEDNQDMIKCFYCGNAISKSEQGRTYKGLDLCRSCWLSADGKDLVKRAKAVLEDSK